MMKNKLLKTFAAIFAVMCLSVPCVVASAGSSVVNVASDESVINGIDDAYWLNFGSVKGNNGNVVFDDTVSSSGRIIASTKIQDFSDCGIEDIFDASYSLIINDIPDGDNNRFSLVYGLDDFESKLGSAGTTEVYFVKENSALKLGVKRFALTDGAEVNVLQPTVFSGLTFGEEITLKVSLDADSLLKVEAGAAGESLATVLDESNVLNFAHSLSGYTGIAQSGKCSAKVTSVNIKAHRYYNAETPLEITENFDNGHYNRNAFFTRSQMDDAGGYAGSCYVENGALKFDVLSSFISTVYRYSNFELTFDLTDVQREPVYDQNGNVLKPAAGQNSWFGISFGVEENKGTFDNHARGNLLFTMQVSENSMRMFKNLQVQDLNGQSLVFYPSAYKTDKMNILNPENDGVIYNYKVTMIDGVFTVMYKTSEDESFPSVPLITTDLGYTPLGSVAIISYLYTGYTIDNIRILNKDIKPEAVTITYEENGLKNTEDFKYTDKWDDKDLISNKPSQVPSSGCGGSVMGITTLIPALIATALIAKRRKNDE